MIPVDQTKFGYPHGNCYAACIASLLEISLDQCPVISFSREWNDKWEEWLAARNLGRIVIKHDPDSPFRGWQILCGLNNTGKTDDSGDLIWHAVVGLHGEIVHDPNPAKRGLLNGEIKEVELLYLLDPNRPQGAPPCATS